MVSWTPGIQRDRGWGQKVAHAGRSCNLIAETGSCDVWLKSQKSPPRPIMLVARNKSRVCGRTRKNTSKRSFCCIIERSAVGGTWWVQFCRILTSPVTSMRWLGSRLLTRLARRSLPLPTTPLRTPRPVLSPEIEPLFRMSPPERHQNALDTRPPIRREMAQQTLNRDAFKKRISVLAASVPADKASLFLKSQELRGCVSGIYPISTAC